MPLPHEFIFNTPVTADDISEGTLTLGFLSAACHQRSLESGFYTDLETGKRKDRNLPEMISLMHSELSEMLEGVRKGKADDHLPNRSSEEVEMADLLIRAFDYIGYRNLDIAGAIREKMAYNAVRADHTLEARRAAGGKKF